MGVVEGRITVQKSKALAIRKFSCQLLHPGTDLCSGAC